MEDLTEIYKLIDYSRKDDLENNKRISLSRPFFQFKSEGKSFKVIRTIREMFDEYGEEKLKAKMLPQIKTLMIDYGSSLPSKKKYSEYDIRSDLQIQMCLFFQTYCGYFTIEKLDDSETLRKYLEQNKSLNETGSIKTHYVKIPIASNGLNHIQWVNKAKTDEMVFFPDRSNTKYWNSNNLCGFLYVHEVEYPLQISARTVFNNFNGKDERRLSSHFTYVGEQYIAQKEERLLFRLPSYSPHQSTVACPDLFADHCCTSIEERVFYDMLSAYEYAKNFPDYIYLRITDFEINEL